MLNNITKEHNIIKKVFAEASSALGYDMWQLIQHGPVEQLNQTEFTQPALLTAGVAIWRLWGQLDAFKPTILAGHSLGEYTALVCAGAISFADALRLVETRGRLMQSTVIAGGGAMAAVLGLEAPQVIELCIKASENTGYLVQAANFNSPGQVVIAGISIAVNKAMDLAKEQGAKKTVLLPVSVPSHCVLMKPIAEQFADQLAEIKWQLPKIPVIQNFDMKVHPDIKSICNALEKQLYNPVNWLEIVQQIASLGISIIAECGPGKVLTSLNKRIRKDVQCIALEEDLALLEQALIEKVQA